MPDDIHPIAYELLTFFFKCPTKEYALRQLERETGFSIGTITKYLKELKARQWVKVRKAANAQFVSANVEHALFRQLKRAHNLFLLYNSGLVEYLQRTFRPDATVLFGSFSKGEDHEESDIDLAIIHGREARPDLSNFEKKMGRRITLTHLKGMDDASKEFRNTLANGIVLVGYIEVVK